MLESLQPEERVALRCVREYLDTETEEAIGASLDAGVDWDRFHQVVHRNHVRPIVYQVLLDGYTEFVPSDIQNRWRSYIQQNVKRNLHLTGELSALLEEFDDWDIRALPFKGPILAAVAYGGLSRREFVDLDIIIEEADFERAKSVLRNRGYEVQYKLSTETGITQTQEALILKFGRECEFVRDKDQVPVDLHWRFLPRRSSFPLSFDEIRERHESVTVAGDILPALSTGDTLLFLGVHGTRHCWRHLRETCDLAALIERKQIDWQTTLERAEALGCRRRLGIGLQLARTLLDVDVPDHVVDRAIVSDPRVSSLVQGAYDRLFGAVTKSISGTISYKYAAHERHRDRLSFLVYWGLYPHRKEIEWVSLPDRLSPLYHVIRPIRLLKESYDRLG